MSEEKRELLKKLKFELAFVEDGGYGRSVRTPHKPTSPFQEASTLQDAGLYGINRDGTKVPNFVSDTCNPAVRSQPSMHPVTRPVAPTPTA